MGSRKTHLLRSATHLPAMTTITAEWLTTKEAAALMRKPVKFVYRLTSERRIRHYKVGNELRFKRADVDDFIEATAVAPLADRRARVPQRRGGRRRGL